jgi:hypothetical protein
MYGPVIDGKMITTTLVDVADLDENVITSYDADGNKTTGNITEQWTDV